MVISEQAELVLDSYERELWHDCIEEPAHLFRVGNSHGYEAGSPSLRVVVLLFESHTVISDLDQTQLEFSHGYERICKEVIEELPEHVEL